MPMSIEDLIDKKQIIMKRQSHVLCYSFSGRTSWNRSHALMCAEMLFLCVSNQLHSPNYFCCICVQNVYLLVRESFLVQELEIKSFVTLIKSGLVQSDAFFMLND